MKLKNALYIVSLFSICAIEAKVTGGRPAGYQPGVTPPGGSAPAQQKPAPVEEKRMPVTSQFKSILDDIRSRNPLNVISANGEIVSGIVDKIQDSNLAPEQKEALLQAAVTVKMPLTNTDNNETAGIIGKAMNQALRLSEKPAMGQIVVKEKTARTPFYDDSTDLMDDEYLMKLINEKLDQRKNPAEILKEISNEYRPYMLAQWKTNGVTASNKLLRDFETQIKTTITRAGRERIEAGLAANPGFFPSKPTPEQQPAARNEKPEVKIAVPEPVETDEEAALTVVSSNAQAIKDELSRINVTVIKEVREAKETIAAVKDLLKARPNLAQQGYKKIESLIIGAFNTLQDGLGLAQRNALNYVIAENFPDLNLQSNNPAAIAPAQAVNFEQLKSAASGLVFEAATDDKGEYVKGSLVNAQNQPTAKTYIKIAKELVKDFPALKADTSANRITLRKAITDAMKELVVGSKNIKLGLSPDQQVQLAGILERAWSEITQ